MKSLSFEFVKNCKAGDLVRVKVGDAAEFAIVGANEERARYLIVLKQNGEPPTAIQFNGATPQRLNFETNAALVYGKFEIRPDHSDRCEITEGRLFAAAGAFICSQSKNDGTNTEKLVVRTEAGPEPQHFDLNNWSLHNGTGGHKAAFKTWSLWHMADPAMPTRLFVHGVGETIDANHLGTGPITYPNQGYA
jgi:hypothetical protein